MGLLGMPSNSNSIPFGNATCFKYKGGTFTNIDAVENLVRYITRSRRNETRLDSLRSFGGAGVGYYLGPNAIIQQICFVQEWYGISSRGGRRMYHEVFNLFDEEVKYFRRNIDEILWKIGMECCQVYFQMGFQVAFAVHWEEGKHWHLHFAVSTINFMTGKKWHTNIGEVNKRSEIFNQILEKYRRIEASNVIIPISFRNDNYEDYDEMLAEL